MIDHKSLGIIAGALRDNLLWERWRPEIEAWESRFPDEIGGCTIRLDTCTFVYCGVLKRDAAAPGVRYLVDLAV